jgi:cellulose synthase (UDP-forming)
MEHTVERRFQLHLFRKLSHAFLFILHCILKPAVAKKLFSRVIGFKKGQFTKTIAYRWQLIWNTVFALPFPIQERMNSFMQVYYPHIDWMRWHWYYVISIPLQTIWLLIKKPIDRHQVSIHRKLFHQGWAATKKAPRRWIHWSRSHATSHAATFAYIIRKIASNRIWQFKLTRYAFMFIATLLGILCITIPFSFVAQALFLVALWVIALWLRSIPGPVPTLVMITLSIIVSTRYIWWRATNTLNYDDMIDFGLGIGLLMAEVYAWLILILGYIQTSWPLHRAPSVLPIDQEEWPTVDLFIPTYNEPLSVVKPTTFSAMGLDWPKEKLNIYILDDGKRDEFRQFAEEVGVGYMVRPDNSYAKAGNLNHALQKTNGEFVTIFDCDHIPTRSFLQVTIGWFLKDQKLALMQTPHHFFSPDPFERNLNSFRTVPNEGELFYGLIQAGNDLWNATFFCGSCAVLRRDPLMEVGGIATETVTEDAHTALKMHRLGYTSAYINLPQAAGLATESLSAHIGQRIRWARGMAQIFRVDNPMFGKGLTWAQRICYSNAMLHFFYGFPRLVFMTAPLAFLLMHAYVIHASAIMIALYVIPHIVHSALTNSRIQGAFRHSMWAEMYEAVLAWYIVRPTTVAILNPDKGKFNVTAKGGLVEHEYFDWMISRPYIMLVLMCVIGFFFGIYRFFYGPADEVSTVVINMVWITYNLLILGGAVAVAAETKQVRTAHRVTFEIPAYLRIPGGKLISCMIEDYSETGLGIAVTNGDMLTMHQSVDVVLQRGLRDFTFPAHVVHLEPGHVGINFDELTNEQESQLIQCTFARADAWMYWNDGRKGDKPLASMKEVLSIGVRGYVRLIEHTMPILLPLLKSMGKMLRACLLVLPRTPDITNVTITKFESNS